MMEKMRVLAEGAKYDVACTSSGSDRAAVKGKLGHTVPAGICHSFSSDGRCISLLKILQTNICIFDCEYCVNRRTNDVERAIFTPEELADLTINFYQRNYIEGLFLSSGIVKNADYTMELMYKTVDILRNKKDFNGYIHMKAIPGADKDLIRLCGFLVDRMSINIEMPSEKSLLRLAPDKTKAMLLNPMNLVSKDLDRNKNELKLYKHSPKFVPAGQSTQMIIGASDDSDRQIVQLAESMYQKFSLKRVFYSAYIPVNKESKLLPAKPAPLAREHRLYQADWLLRFYDFKSEEILSDNENLPLEMDPKAFWAIKNLDKFPVEINNANYFELIRIPGIGSISARKILRAKKVARLSFADLKAMRISLKRAKYFITCNGKVFESFKFEKDYLALRLIEKSPYQQINLFDKMQIGNFLEEKKEFLKIL